MAAYSAKRVDGRPVEPAAVVLERLRQVPVVERDHRLDAGREQLVDEPVVEREPLGVGPALAGRLDPRPRDREAVAVGRRAAASARRPRRSGGSGRTPARPTSRRRSSRACAVKVSQMLGPLPSLLAAPSIWYAAVLVPNRKPGGNRGMPSGCESPTGTICHVTVEIRRGTDRFVDRAPGRLTAARLLVRLVATTPDHVSVRADGLPRRPPAAARARGSRTHAHCRPGDRHLGALGRARARRLDRRRRRGRARAGRGAPHRRRRRAQRGRGGAADPVRPGLADRAGARASRRTTSRRPSCRRRAGPRRRTRAGRRVLGGPARRPPDRHHPRRAAQPTSTSPAARCSAPRSPSRCTTATRSCSPTSPPTELTAGVPDRAAGLVVRLAS